MGAIFLNDFEIFYGIWPSPFVFFDMKRVGQNQTPSVIYVDLLVIKQKLVLDSQGYFRENIAAIKNRENKI